MGGATSMARDGLGLIANSGDIEELAGSVDHADGVVIVPAFAGLGTPIGTAMPAVPSSA